MYCLLKLSLLIQSLHHQQDLSVPNLTEGNSTKTSSFHAVKVNNGNFDVTQGNCEEMIQCDLPKTNGGLVHQVQATLH